MFRLLSDENLHGDLVKALRTVSDIDFVRVQDVGLRTKDDAAILDWAASVSRIILTHDRKTMIGHAYARVRAGQKMPGVFHIDDRISIGQALEEIKLRVQCTQPEEWEGMVDYIS